VQRLMMQLDWLIAKIADVPRECEYFINTIDAIDASDDNVAFEGRCSPVVRSAHHDAISPDS